MGEKRSNLVTGMVKEFFRGEDAIDGICEKLLMEQEEGSVCLKIDEKDEAIVKNSPFVSSLDDGQLTDEHCLLIYDAKQKLLYTRRNWKYEECVRQRINEMMRQKDTPIIPIPADGDFAQLKECQRRAVGIMLSRQFSILTGGPGTGKTYTIARAVKLARTQKSDLRIGLAAPTGKAAARVRESMGDAGQLEATTIHSLLGSNYDGVTFRHNRDNPLDLDWLIIDEASMIDLPLMAKLLDALKPECKLTLVGDANQLSSVEPGRVFGDLCAIPELQNSIAQLTESSRVRDAKALLNLAEAVNRGDAETVLRLLGPAADESIRYYPLHAAGKQEETSFFLETILCYLKEYSRKQTPEDALNALNDCRVLCVVRKGPYGTEKLNSFIGNAFQQSCPIPMMVSRNDSGLGVSNGDVGVVMPDNKEHLHLLKDGELRPAIPIVLLPALEKAFATTIHKSQGSEFDHVVIVLPPVRGNGEEGHVEDLLTRELLYTAITRAKKSVTIFADDESVRRCCRQRTERRTGLRFMQRFSTSHFTNQTNQTTR